MPLNDQAAEWFLDKAKQLESERDEARAIARELRAAIKGCSAEQLRDWHKRAPWLGEPR